MLVEFCIGAAACRHHGVGEVILGHAFDALRIETYVIVSRGCSILAPTLSCCHTAATRRCHATRCFRVDGLTTRPSLAGRSDSQRSGSGDVFLIVCFSPTYIVHGARWMKCEPTMSALFYHFTKIIIYLGPIGPIVGPMSCSLCARMSISHCSTQNSPVLCFTSKMKKVGLYVRILSCPISSHPILSYHIHLSVSLSV